MWYFDTEAGKKEILYRRIGRNELSAIRVCQELVAAQKEYCGAAHGEYAQQIFSDEGQHDGLYWKAANGEPAESHRPAGSVSRRRRVLPRARTGAPTPYRGYYFHILTAGEGNKKGAKSYLVDGKMTAGFAFVAYPAEYRSSGVMTFIVNQDGVVYEKDLGPKTESIARNMKGYGPTAGWQKSEGQQQEMASEPATQAK